MKIKQSKYLIPWSRILLEKIIIAKLVNKLLLLGLAYGIFLSGFPIKILYQFLNTPVRTTCFTSVILSL